MAVVAAIVLVVWLLADIVLVIFMAALIAVMLRGVADWAADRTGVSQRAMLAIVTVLVVLVLAGFLYYIGPRLLAQSHDLWTRLRQTLEQVRQSYGDTPWGKALFSDMSPPKAVQSHIVSYAGTVASVTLGGALTGFILIITALYFAISPELYIGGIVRLFPHRHRPLAQSVLRDIGVTLRRWSLGQLIDMAVVAVLTGVGLTILGVPLSLALAVLAGLFTFVPYFGAIAAAVPAVLLAFTISWQTSLWVIVIFVICHTVEGYLVAPIVQRNTAHLPPALTILSMTILGTVFGPLGIILGAPVCAALLVLVREAYVGAVLGDDLAEE
ncbi:MAG TPA: AI-2E family transporter [Acetobacteraceae bacterium]|nr:AI-2E family transporter [Acetobacteraceae bacterium]